MFWVITIEMYGTILDINPGSLLQYTLRNSDAKEGPDNFSTVTDVLREANGVTTLAVTDDIGSADGWEDRLKKIGARLGQGAERIEAVR